MNKKLFSLFVIIIIALSLSCVSASDSSIISDNSSDIVGVSNDEPIIYDSGNAGDEAVGNVSNNVGTYTDLNNEINNAGSTLILDKDYKYNTNLQAIINKKGIVKETIYPNKVGIVIIEGESWSAISYDNEKIDKEEMVEVLKIEGVKVVVKKID